MLERFVPPAAADRGRGVAISVVGVPAPGQRTVTSGTDCGLQGKNNEVGAKQEKTRNIKRGESGGAGRTVALSGAVLPSWREKGRQYL